MGVVGNRVDTYTPSLDEDSAQMDSKESSCLHCTVAATALRQPATPAAAGSPGEAAVAAAIKMDPGCQFESPFLALKPLLRMFQGLGIFNFSIYNGSSDFVCR